MTTKISSSDFVRYVLIAVAVIAAAALLWKVVDVALVAFGGIVFAAVFRAIGSLLVKFLRVPEKLSVILAIVLLLLLFAGLAWLFGDQLAQQFDQLQVQLPKAIDAIKGRLVNLGGGKFLDDLIDQSSKASPSLGNIAKIAGLTVGFLGHAVVMVFVGIYLALDPTLYLRTVVRLFPPSRRQTVRRALSASGDALRKWLIGQLAAMATIAVLTSVGLGFVGVPLALALGVLAGLLDFVPVVGPVIAAIPGVILAAAADPRKAIYALIVYIAVQQLENHVVVPLTQRWSVSLPPAFAVLSIVTLGLLFGLLGVIFAMPLTVVSMILIRELYLPAIEQKKD
ncbi:MAG TPA: AI-2E family transporter [Opitutaceae bacterium]|nr:AI-2E family transporter [Opitutaceae bacterium]